MTYSFDYKTRKVVEETTRTCPGDGFVVSWIKGCIRRAAQGYEPCRRCAYRKIDLAKKNPPKKFKVSEHNWMEEAYNVTHDHS